MSTSAISCAKGCLCAKTTEWPTEIAAFTKQRRLKLVLVQVSICKICLNAQNEVSPMLLHEVNCTSRVWSLVMHLVKSISGEASLAQKQGPLTNDKMLDVLEKGIPAVLDRDLAIDLKC